MKLLVVQITNINYKKLLQMVFILSLFIQLVIGGVEIVKPYHPLYVKCGSNLTIACESKYTKSTMDLKWIHQTAQTSWADQPIEALLGSDVVIQSLREEPSGFTRITLIKHNMSLLDRGTYICKDDTSSYAVWVTVLYVTAQNLTHISSGVDPLILGCSISGFDSNVPTIDYDWTFNDSFIFHPHYDFPSIIQHSPTVQAPKDKYKVTMENNLVRLEIHDPSSLDGGSYKCVFVLSTNLGPVEFSESFYVDGALLTSRNLGVKPSIPFHVIVTAVFLIAFAVV